MTDTNPQTPSTADIATQAAVTAIVESVEKNGTPCTDKDQACNRRWIESISDCC